MLIDSRLRIVYGGKSGPDCEQEQLAQQLLTSLGPEGIDGCLGSNRGGFFSISACTA